MRPKGADAMTTTTTPPTTWDDLSGFAKAYVAALLWTEEEELNAEAEERHMREPDQFSLAPETLARIADDCAEFEREAKPYLDATLASDERNGTDFWLTRNGHGAGFWDRGYGEVGGKLSKIASLMGTCDAYIGDGGLIYLS